MSQLNDIVLFILYIFYINVFESEPTEMSEKIVFTNPWQINELSEAPIDHLTFGIIDEDPMGIVRVIKDTVGTEQVAEIIKVGELVGEYRKVDWLYQSVMANISLLLDNYRLDEDGMVSLPEKGPNRYQYQVACDALFHSIITAGKKYLDEVEHALKKRRHKNSDSYIRWKQLTANIYDKSLVYALMYDLRNRLEHEFWTISLVNVDEGNRLAGMAINIDNDLMNLDLKPSTRKRLRKWALDCGERGDPAWLSLGKCVRNYKSLICSLHILYLDGLLNQFTRTIEESGHILNSIPGNLIIWSGEKTAHFSVTGNLRAYQIPKAELADSISREQECILAGLDDNPEVC